MQALVQPMVEVTEGNQRQSEKCNSNDSPAAEACYWRALIRGWHRVARPVEDMWGDSDSEGPENGEGVRFETFSLTGKVQWDQRRSSRPE